MQARTFKNQNLKSFHLMNSFWSFIIIFTVYYFNLMNEIPVLQIPQVMSGYIDKLIETRGLVVLSKVGLIKLQEKSSVINKTGTLSLSILVEVSKETVENVGDYVKIIGVPQIKKSKGSSAAQIIIQCQEIVIISDDEADLSKSQEANSFFIVQWVVIGPSFLWQL